MRVLWRIACVKVFRTSMLDREAREQLLGRNDASLKRQPFYPGSWSHRTRMIRRVWRLVNSTCAIVWRLIKYNECITIVTTRMPRGLSPILATRRKIYTPLIAATGSPWWERGAEGKKIFRFSPFINMHFADRALIARDFTSGAVKLYDSESTWKSFKIS